MRRLYCGTAPLWRCNRQLSREDKNKLMPAPSKNYLNPRAIEEDRETLKALEALVDYAPQNPAYSTEALRTRERKVRDGEQRVLQAQQVVLQAQQMLAAERAYLREGRTEFHDGMREGKAQVVAQYGSDSPVLELLGIRRVSQRRRAASGRRRKITRAP
jgi:hypothetical protein